MHFSETKRIYRTIVVLIALLFLLPFLSSADEYSSASFSVFDPVIDQGSDSSTSTNFGLGQSIGQTAIGKSTSASFQLWSGFQYFFDATANVLTATAGDTQVSLSWTVPTTFLGITIGSYEVGVGTTSGSYVFTNVGNTTNHIENGLSNGTTYYFIIKALSPAGSFLVFSNEDSATPTGVAPPPPPPSGGGGPPPAPTGGSNIVFNGYAYPNSNVSLVKDLVLVSTTTAAANGSFSINLTNQSAGNYNFSLYGTDAGNITSANLNINQSIVSNTTTTLNNLIIAPTITASHVTIKQGDPLTVSGYTGPNAPVTLNFTGPTNSVYNVTANDNGYYSYVFNTASVAKGNYTVTAKSKVINLDSPPSKSFAFSIGDSSTQTPTDCRRSDLNCDGRVNLIDFSILLYFWDSTSFSRNPRVDIDKSGRIGLRDLSIMLYDWTG